MRPEIYKLFADVLDYPSAILPVSVRQLLHLLPEGLPGSVNDVAAFQSALETAGITRFQELYIHTFDFRADCSLYVGHYLFGESGRRGAFLAELSDRYRERKLPGTTELPDHISCLLRYLAALEPGEESNELIHGCLIPSLLRITAAAAIARSPYRVVLKTLLAFLQQKDGDQADSGEFAWTSSSSSPFPILQ
jgi:nitrate reductase delta subunit